MLLYAQPFVTKGTYRDVSERLEGYLSLSGNVRHLFDLRSGDTFLIKASYWINW